MKNAEQYAKHHLGPDVTDIQNSGRNTELPELTISEKAIIFKYSEDGYLDTNETLRSSIGVKNTAFGEILYKCLAKLPDFEGLVYRGVNLTKSELKKYTDAFKEGTPITEYPFLSSSKSRLIAMAFGANTLFRIYSRTGKEIEKISKFGTYNPPNEKEVLFMHSRFFSIMEITKEAGYTLITMEEIK